MANNYCNFSTTLQKITEKEQEWLNAVSSLDVEEEWEKFHELVPEAERGEFDYCLRFDMKLIKRHDGTTDLWISSGEESGQPYHAAVILKELLKRFRPTEIVTYEWADFCDKLCADEFGGGCVVVTAKEILIESTGQASDRLKKLAQRNLVG